MVILSLKDFNSINFFGGAKVRNKFEPPNKKRTFVEKSFLLKDLNSTNFFGAAKVLNQT
jgi:hypothetical protein